MIPVWFLAISSHALVADPCLASRAMNCRCSSGVHPFSTSRLRGTGSKSSRASTSGSGVSGSFCASCPAGASAICDSFIGEREANEIQIGKRELPSAFTPPLNGEGKGWGDPRHGSRNRGHPHPTSPIEGEERRDNLPHRLRRNSAYF